MKIVCLAPFCQFFYMRIATVERLCDNATLRFAPGFMVRKCTILSDTIKNHYTKLYSGVPSSTTRLSRLFFHNNINPKQHENIPWNAFTNQNVNRSNKATV